jgi:hypothetical protein
MGNAIVPYFPTGRDAACRAGRKQCRQHQRHPNRQNFHSHVLSLLQQKNRILYPLYPVKNKDGGQAVAVFVGTG